MNIVDIAGGINLPFSASSLLYFAVWTAADPPDSLNSLIINSNQNNPPTLVTLVQFALEKRRQEQSTAGTIVSLCCHLPSTLSVAQ